MNEKEIGEYNITIAQGTDFSRTFQWLEDDDTPVDLTDYTFHAQIREYPEGNLAIDFTVSVVPAQGQYTLFLDHDKTANMLFERGTYDIFYVHALTGLRNIIQRGNVTVLKRSTQL